MIFKKVFSKIRSFFEPKDIFLEDEWLLRHQVFAILIISFNFALGVLPFSFVRINEGNILVGSIQLLLSLFLLFGFFKLKYDKTFYKIYSIAFMFTFFLYCMIIFFYVPQNHLNILWVVSAPVLIFFFLNRKGGIVMFIWVFTFILFLLLSQYPYSVAEYITLISTVMITTFVMFIYERVKEAENKRLFAYNISLQSEVAKQTNKMKALNVELENRVKREVDKQITQEQMLLRQARMASIGEMIDAIAHQWRQPLMNINAVMMNLDRGIDTKKENEYLKEKILEVFSLTSHMSHTIEDFRNLLKVEKEKEIFSIKSVTSDVMALIQNNLKGININCAIEENIMIESYKSELSQVFITLLSNASEALNTRNIENKKINIYLNNNDDYIVLCVEDNAGGIEKENLSKIFDPYFTTKKQTGGTGLGLYITKIIVEHSMKGKLEVLSTDEGVVFSVFVPRH